MLTDYQSPITIEERTTTGGSFGTVTWSELTDDFYKGFIQPIGGGEAFRDGKAGEQATHRLYTGIVTPSKYGYRVTQNGQSYIMLYAIQPNGISGVNDHQEIILGVFE